MFHPDYGKDKFHSQYMECLVKKLIHFNHYFNLKCKKSQNDNINTIFFMSKMMSIMLFDIIWHYKHHFFWHLWHLFDIIWHHKHHDKWCFFTSFSTIFDTMHHFWHQNDVKWCQNWYHWYHKHHDKWCFLTSLTSFWCQRFQKMMFFDIISHHLTP